MSEREQLRNESVCFDETSLPSRERNPTYPPSRERNVTSRESNPSSRGSSRGTNPPSRESASLETRKRIQSVYSQRQSIKPLNIETIMEAQKRISLNPAYMTCKKLDKNTLEQRLNEKVKLTKVCHRPVTVPLGKIVGKIPEHVDFSILLGLRKAFEELQRDYHNIVEARRYNIHRRHVELMEINKITSERLRKRFIETLKAYGISPSVISDVLEEIK